MCRAFLALYFCIASFTALAEGSSELKRQVLDAIARVDALDYQGSDHISYSKNFSFTNPMFSMQRRVHFDPALPSRWQLLEDNGQAPSAEAVAEYQNKTVPEFERDLAERRELGILHPLLPYIDLASLTQVYAKEGERKIGFRVKNKPNSDKLDGELILARADDGEYLREFSIQIRPEEKHGWIDRDYIEQFKFGVFEQAGTTYYPLISMYSLDSRNFKLTEFRVERNETYSDFAVR